METHRKYWKLQNVEIYGNNRGILNSLLIPIGFSFKYLVESEKLCHTKANNNSSTAQRESIRRKSQEYWIT